MKATQSVLVNVLHSLYAQAHKGMGFTRGGTSRAWAEYLPSRFFFGEGLQEGTLVEDEILQVVGS